MEAPAEEVSMGAKDQTHFVKGKRTKRVRPQSPMPFSTIAKNGDKDDGADNKNSSGTTSSTEFEGNHNNNNISSSSSTEEEADMANCLILLAQGQSRDSPKLAGEDGTMMMMKYSDNCNNNNNNNNNNINSSSRKFMEAAAMGANKAGFYVYECKTCNRTFPSFQALGGHRASHKKPKALASMAAIVDQEKKKEEESIFYKNNNNHQHHNSNTLSIQFLNSGSNGGNKNKVHECSICGAEFASGQALGGHMRRHRTPIGTTTPTTSLALNNNPVGLEADQYQDQDHHQSRKKRNVLSLDLDLNLPAPEDDHTDSSSSKFAFESKQQQQPQQQQQQQQQASLVFASAPALVDCHY